MFCADPPAYEMFTSVQPACVDCWTRYQWLLVWSPVNVWDWPSPNVGLATPTCAHEPIALGDPLVPQSWTVYVNVTPGSGSVSFWTVKLPTVGRHGREADGVVDHAVGTALVAGAAVDERQRHLVRGVVDLRAVGEVAPHAVLEHVDGPVTAVGEVELHVGRSPGAATRTS